MSTDDEDPRLGSSSGLIVLDWWLGLSPLVPFSVCLVGLSGPCPGKPTLGSAH
ncbi:hypothetical protein HanPI659440_Chr08g0291791 [Helianthus annuus]|nr:hypothetical protein HanPI659440_Chr08g0291791 [Helianthus annuus]